MQGWWFVQGRWDKGPGVVGGSCVFWFQESTVLLFCVSFVFHKCLALNVGTRISPKVRDVDGLWICIMGVAVFCFCSWNCGQWTLVLCCSFTVFLCLVWELEVFGAWWWFLDPAVDLLLAAVVVVALHVVVPVVHHRTFFYIEVHLPLVFFNWWICLDFIKLRKQIRSKIWLRWESNWSQYFSCIWNNTRVFFWVDPIEVIFFTIICVVVGD